MSGRPVLLPHELRKLVLELSKLAPRRWGPGAIEQQVRRRGFRATGPEISRAMDDLGLLTPQERAPCKALPAIMDAARVFKR